MLYKTHVLLRKELLKHFRALNSTEAKIFIAILIMANPKTGKLTIPMKKLAGKVNLSYRLTNRAVIRLQDMSHINYSYDRFLRESKIEAIDYLSLIDIENSEPRFTMETDSENQSEVSSECHTEPGSEQKLSQNDTGRKSVPSDSKPIPVEPNETINPSNEDQKLRAPAEMIKEKLIDAIARDFNEAENIEMIRSICLSRSIPVIEKAFESARNIPAEKIKRSRMALFVYFLKKHAEEKN